MSKLRRVGSSRLLARLLDEPDLAPIVQSLEPKVLVGLVRHVGLEDAGEIMSLATIPQLESMFDEDLWASAGGGEAETFDAARFALWLDVLLGAGEAQAVEKLAQMDEDFLALGLSRLVLVLDLDAIAAEMSERDDDEHDAIEKALESQLYEELEEFRVVARDARAWDAVVTLLVGMDQSHHATLRRVLERVAAAAASRIDDEGGLYEVLTSAETLEEDVAGEREDRREREGFVSPSQAAAFLRLALVTPIEELLGSDAKDPVERAFLRAQPAARPAPKAPTPEARALSSALREAGALPETGGSRPVLATSEGANGVVRAALATLRETAPATFAARLDELAFVVNVVVAACGGERVIHPADATDAALAMCDGGATRVGAHLGVDPAATVARRSLVHLFRVGFHALGADPWSRETFTRRSANEPATTPRGRRSPRRGPR